MSITSKFYLMLVGCFGLMCLLAYELYQGYGVIQNQSKAERLDLEEFELTRSKAETPFIATPIELPKSEVVILQPKEIQIPQAKEVKLPKPVMPKQSIIVIKGAASALIPNSNGVIK